jgi:hypothetical protein
MATSRFSLQIKERQMSGSAFWIIQAPGWLLFIYLVFAQCAAAFSYNLGVRMGTQEPAMQITEVGAAFWWALAFADLVFYTPLLGLGPVEIHLEFITAAPM